MDPTGAPLTADWMRGPITVGPVLTGSLRIRLSRNLHFLVRTIWWGTIGHAVIGQMEAGLSAHRADHFFARLIWLLDQDICCCLFLPEALKFRIYASGELGVWGKV